MSNNICTNHDLGEYEERAFIVMELLEGQTLKQRIGNRPMQLEELLELSTLRSGSRGGARVGNDAGNAGVYRVHGP